MGNNYDVIIVGAGTAGLSAAEELDNSGLKVLVLEKNKSLDKGVLNLKATFMNTLKKFNLEKTIKRIYNSTGFYGPTKKTATNMKKENTALFDLFKALKMMKKRSKNIDFRFNSEIIEIKRQKTRIRLTDENNTDYHCKMLLVTTGNSSAITEQLGILREKAYYKLYGFELKNCNIKKPNEAVFFIDRKYAKTGWWVYPITKNRCQIVIGDVAPLVELTKNDMRVNLLRAIKEFKHYNLSKAKEVKGTELFIEYPIDPLEKMIDDRMLFVGDAAGQATPIMGEGIRVSLEMGREAAKVVKKAFKKRDLTTRTLKEYDNIWWDRFGKYYFYGIILRHYMVCHLTNDDFDDIITRFGKLSNQDQYKFIKSRFSVDIINKLISFHSIKDAITSTFKTNISKLSTIKGKREFTSRFV